MKVRYYKRKGVDDRALSIRACYINLDGAYGPKDSNINHSLSNIKQYETSVWYTETKACLVPWQTHHQQYFKLL